MREMRVFFLPNQISSINSLLMPLFRPVLKKIMLPLRGVEKHRGGVY
jgi:hypothetical protein